VSQGLAADARDEDRLDLAAGPTDEPAAGQLEGALRIRRCAIELQTAAGGQENGLFQVESELQLEKNAFDVGARHRDPFAGR
jgi:hypothetical protein